MEREKINTNYQILMPLLGFKNDVTHEEYCQKLYDFEREREKSLIETFGRVGINAIVKSDPYSLPYKNEIIVTLSGESYLNGPYEFFRVARVILRKILNENIQKIRFYITIDIIPPGKIPLGRGGSIMGDIVYKFRYYEH